MKTPDYIEILRQTRSLLKYGDISAIARTLGVHRNTIFNVLRGYQTVQGRVYVIKNITYLKGILKYLEKREKDINTINRLINNLKEKEDHDNSSK